MASMDPAELEAVMAVTGAFLEELAASGALVFAGGLHPPSTAVTVDHTGDGLAVADGPYTQAPEYLGGFWVVEAPDQEAAVAWAAKASKALGARIEVRAFQDVPAQGVKTGEQHPAWTRGRAHRPGRDPGVTTKVWERLGRRVGRRGGESAGVPRQPIQGHMTSPRKMGFRYLIEGRR